MASGDVPSPRDAFPACQILHAAKAIVEFPKQVIAACRESTRPMRQGAHTVWLR